MRSVHRQASDTRGSRSTERIISAVCVIYHMVSDNVDSAFFLLPYLGCRNFKRESNRVDIRVRAFLFDLLDCNSFILLKEELVSPFGY